ncbi:MAG: alkaline phosphatase family protein [Verrucomicrobia bacterium]|nr:alkaline phosphatase family protein [Verrucomicrobiota bacterium]MBI3871285.1 alkaline phosphatase family protein [Verrucomicrobiota bacterium]
MIHPILRISLTLCLVASALVVGGQPVNPNPAEHVVLVVWDGMRPDFVAPQFCPNLYSLATNGVFFRNHHPAFISSTEVNGAALATGSNPGRNGILANTEYGPEFSYLSSYATEGIDAVRRGDSMTGGHYILTPTVAEILHDAGIATIMAGSKPVAQFHDRSRVKTTSAQKQSVLLYEGKTIPRDLVESLKKVNDDKVFPPTITQPNTPQDNWTTRALTKSLWKGGVPKYTLLWLSDPDKSQHETGVGSPTSLEGIESSDKNLGEVIKALKDKGVWEKTDLMLVSDHGFSTINRTPNVQGILKKAGFSAFTKLEDPERGDVMVVGLGGSALLYVVERDDSVTRRLVEFLQTTDFVGDIFCRLPVEGTFPFESVGYATTTNAPDIILSLRWSAETNAYGAPGLMTTVGGTAGKGSHASLSRFDMNNTLVAHGPDFKRGIVSRIPSGNVDVGPTILWLLGIKPAETMDGRVLHEGLSRSIAPMPSADVKTLDAERDIGLFHWHQYLKFSTVGSTRYFDEGNGAASHR